MTQVSIFRGQDLLNVLFSILDKAGALGFRKPLKNVISVCVPKSLLNFWLLLTSDVICVTFLQIRVPAKRKWAVHHPKVIPGTAPTISEPANHSTPPKFQCGVVPGTSRLDM